MYALEIDQQSQRYAAQQAAPFTAPRDSRYAKKRTTTTAPSPNIPITIRTDVRRSTTASSPSNPRIKHHDVASSSATTSRPFHEKIAPSSSTIKGRDFASGRQTRGTTVSRPVERASNQVHSRPVKSSGKWKLEQFSRVIWAAGKKEDTLTLASRLLRTMRSESVYPDVVFFNALVAHAAKCGKLR